MVQKNLKPLRSGFIRGDSLLPGKGNRQLKIGGAAFNRVIKTRETDGKQRDNAYRKQTKALKVSLPKLYTNPTFKDVNQLVKNKYKFNDNDVAIIKNVLQTIEEESKNNFIVFKMKNGNKKYIPILYNSIEPLTNILKSGYFEREAYESKSDALNEIFTEGFESMKVKNYKKEENKNYFKNGRFFRYLNTTDINLEKYQIISKDSDMEILNDHCFTYTLKQHGVSEELINRVKTTFQSGSSFSKNNINKVCDMIEKNINLKCYDKKNKLRTEKYGKKYTETLEIVLYKEHYFINEQTEYSKYSSLNYQEIKDKKDYHEIYEKAENYYNRSKKKYKVNSLTLVKNLLETGNFIKDHHIIKSRPEAQKLNYKEETLKLIEQEQEYYNFKEKGDDKKTIRYFADIETDVNSGKHIPILIRFTKTGDNIDDGFTYERQQNDNDHTLYNRFMNSLVNKTYGYDKVIVYFHNLKYDYHTLKKFIFHMGAPCEKDGQFYSVKILFKKRLFEFKDSAKLAQMPLRDFQKSFQLPEDLNKKEAIAYRYYTIYNMQDLVVNVKDYEKFLKDNEKETFMKSLKENPDFRYNKENQTFNPIAYYKYYLKYDTFIMMKGLEKFEQIINDIIKGLNETFNKNYTVSMFDYLTISSLTHAIMGMYGAYDDVFEMSGNLREFCGNFVTGGRVQVNQEYVKKLIEEKLADYDGVSLYPSSINRLCKEFGLPKGKAKQIQTKDKKELDKFDYYMVKIKINKINKFQQLPMVSYKDKNGSLKYVNEIDEPITAYVDMITLADWIEFQEIEYEILEGVYYNEGYNKTMGIIIEHLFKERLKHKKAKNQAMQLILKLMMNASYGKTITKKTMKKKTVVNQNLKEAYINNNFQTIISWDEVSDVQTIVTQNANDNSYNMAHVGVFILSMSKRIMNEVFNTANKLGCPLYYTDTDSIHCNYDDVVKIEEQFRKDYNRELTGKNLGQFHIDFNLDGAASEIYSKSAIFLGKKCYIDKLESKDKNGNIITGYHYRMKGVNVQGIEHCADTYFKGDVFEVYKHLSKGDEQEFILNPKGKKPSFEYLKTGGIRTRPDDTFRRTLKF